MNPDKRNLLDDLLENPDAQTRRAATLSAGGRLLRRKRWTRTALRAGGPLLVIAVAAVWISVQKLPHRETKPQIVVASKPAVTYLTDEQLLALFPNTPVGLATVGHRKVLIFPNPSDKQRFVGRF